MSLLQRRQPKGAPTGGQFATTGRAESGTTLAAPQSWHPMPSQSRSWQPELERGVDQALGTLHQNVATDDEEFPATQHAAALGALHDLADALLARRGVQLTAPRGNDELVDLRTAVAERSVSDDWPERKRDLVIAALGDVNLARKADKLARMSVGRYDLNAVHYLMALEKARREAAQ